MAEEKELKEKLADKFKEFDVKEEVIDELVRTLVMTARYEPKVGIFGKTGMGKSELCNALFGKDVAEVSDVESCTKNPEEYLLELQDEYGIKLIDVPGVGENHQFDEKYEELYKKLLPKLDLALWVFKSDERSFSIDEHYFNHLLKPNLHTTPFLVIINQVDKIEPYREWNTTENLPGPKQIENIHKKRISIQNKFDIPLDDIIPVSASESYGLQELVVKMLKKLPDKIKPGLYLNTRQANRSKESEKEAKSGFINVIMEKCEHLLKEHGDKIVALIIAALWEIWKNSQKSKKN